MRTPTATAFGSFGYAWQQMRKYFLPLFLIAIILAVANVPTFGWSGDDEGFKTAGFLSLFAAVYGLLVVSIVNYGGDWLYLRFIRDERANIADVFAGFKKGYLNIVLANLLVFAIIGIGFVLLIVPGIVFACRLTFVPYLVMDKGLDCAWAIEKSWSMTRGHGFRIFGMVLISIVLFFCGLTLLGVGALFAMMWISSAFASLYHAIDLEDQARLNQNGATA